MFKIAIADNGKRMVMDDKLKPERIVISRNDNDLTV